MKSINTNNSIQSSSSGFILSNKATPAQLSNDGSLLSGVNAFLTNQNSNNNNPAKPKAYITWILFDEQFKYVSSSSGSEQVGSDEVFTSHVKNNLPVDKNGYLYIYLSNETPNINVYFDNLQVSHIRGPLLEETHYYPFGLTMAGISSKAVGGIENKKKYNGIEHNTDLGLNQYDAFYRTLDPQIGRFWQVDPKIESAEAWSPYSAMLNNPIRFADPLGDSSIKPQIPNALVNAMKNYFSKNAEKKAEGKADDCITCHNKGMKIVTNNPKLKVGSKANETRENATARLCW